MLCLGVEDNRAYMDGELHPLITYLEAVPSTTISSPKWEERAFRANANNANNQSCERPSSSDLLLIVRIYQTLSQNDQQDYSVVCMECSLSQLFASIFNPPQVRSVLRVSYICLASIMMHPQIIN